MCVRGRSRTRGVAGDMDEGEGGEVGVEVVPAEAG